MSQETEEPIAVSDEQSSRDNSQAEQEAKAAKKAEKAAAKAAKKAEKAARPKMPKFCHFLTVLFALNCFATLMLLAFTSRDLVSYSSINLLDWANVVFEIVLLWMLWCRFKIARPFVMAYTVLNVSVGVLRALFGSGDFSLAYFILPSAFDVMLFLYFWRSKKTKAYLTEDFGIDKSSALGETAEFKIDRRSWPFWRNIGIYFCVFSILGHWMEAGFCMLIRLGVVAGEFDLNNTMLWRDWFYPFPMHGAAVVLIALLLYPLFIKLREKISLPIVAYAISFFINGILCVCIEYSVGCVVNADLQLWNYSNMFMNFQGQICLQNGVGFALASSAICWWVYPWLEKMLARVPKNIMNLAFVVVLACYAIPQTLYLVDSPIPYKQELEEVLATDSLTDEQREYYESEYNKLLELQEKGVTLAGPDGDK